MSGNIGGTSGGGLSTVTTLLRSIVQALNGITTALGNGAPAATIGYGSWQNVAASRAFNTAFTNNNSRPLCVSATANFTSAGVTFYSYVNGNYIALTASVTGTGGQYPASAFIIVPPGQTYGFWSTSSPTILYWNEL